MKKKMIYGFLALFAFASMSAQNQSYVVSDNEGVPYENNSIHVFNIYGTGEQFEEAKLHLFLENLDFDNDIYVRAEIVQIINTDGSLAQFCIGGPSGECFSSVSEGSYYPIIEGGIVYKGDNWGIFDYFVNLDPNNLAEYKIRFVQTDGDGNEIPNTNFFISYRYDENYMGVSDVQSVAIAEVYPTVAKGFTNVNLKENAQVQIVNAEGRTVKTFSLKSGQSQLNLSGLSAGVYWVTFKGDSGKTTHTRIVVK